MTLCGRFMNSKWFFRISQQPTSISRFWKDNFLIFREFKYFPRFIFLALLFSLLAAAFEGLGLSLLLTFLQSLTNEASPTKTGMRWIDVWVLASYAPTQARLYRISTLIFLITLCRAILSYLAIVYSGYCSLKLGYQVRLRIFEQFRILPLAYFIKTRSGELVNSITTEINNVVTAFDMFSNMIITSITLMVYLASMLILSWQLTIISILVF